MFNLREAVINFFHPEPAFKINRVCFPFDELVITSNSEDLKVDTFAALICRGQDCPVKNGTLLIGNTLVCPFYRSENGFTFSRPCANEELRFDI